MELKYYNSSNTNKKQAKQKIIQQKRSIQTQQKNPIEMKLRNNKAVPFLGKDLPKRKRKVTKTAKSSIEALSKPIIQAEEKNLDVAPPSVPITPTKVSPETIPPAATPPTATLPVPTLLADEMNPGNVSFGSNSNNNDIELENIFEQSSYEEESEVNRSLKRFSRGTPRSSKPKTLQSTMNKGTNTTNELSFDFGQVEHQSTIIETLLSPTMVADSDVEDEVDDARPNIDDHFPIPYADASNDSNDMTVFDFNSEDSNEVSLIPDTDSEDSDLPRPSFNPVGLVDNDAKEAESVDQNRNKTDFTDAIIPTWFFEEDEHQP